MSSPALLVATAPAAGKFVGIGKAAEQAGVSTETIRRWCDAGHLPSWRTPGGHRRILLDAVEKLARPTSARVLP
ncbi:MerR family DNA-binding transcriptional regulator [Pseudonocardia alni]|uniref:MerR family DNA-binding transcriptional regulator n=1 Tax=Pseudonocardia alni TaxID=33907 RepID=UPI0015C82E2D